MKKNLPIYEVKIDMNDDSVGMFMISLVDEPAVGKYFYAFNQDKKSMTYKVTNTEQQKVFGLVICADTPIYRVDKTGFEYYLTYSKESIALMVEKYFKNGFQNNVDTNHNLILEDGITLTQMFIKNTDKGINPVGFEDVKDGSLFAEFHIENQDVWNSVKDGSYKGFSLAGCFNVEEKPKEDERVFEDIMKMLDEITKIK